MMTEEAKLARNEYMKQYREKNKERIAATRRKYEATHKEQKREANARYWAKYAVRKKAEATHGVGNNDPATDGTV